MGGRKGTLTLWFRSCINFLYHLVGSYNYSRAKNEEGFVCKHYDWPCQELFTANLCCDSNRSSVWIFWGGLIIIYIYIFLIVYLIHRNRMLKLGPVRKICNQRTILAKSFSCIGMGLMKRESVVFIEHFWSIFIWYHLWTSILCFCIYNKLTTCSSLLLVQLHKILVLNISRNFLMPELVFMEARIRKKVPSLQALIISVRPLADLLLVSVAQNLKRSPRWLQLVLLF